MPARGDTLEPADALVLLVVAFAVGCCIWWFTAFWAQPLKTLHRDHKPLLACEAVCQAVGMQSAGAAYREGDAWGCACAGATW